MRSCSWTDGAMTAETIGRMIIESMASVGRVRGLATGTGRSEMRGVELDAPVWMDLRRGSFPVALWPEAQVWRCCRRGKR